MFWTDSEAVLGYMRNQSIKFKTFEASKNEMIREHSKQIQWFYVNSKENQADHSSRDIGINNSTSAELWYPQFLGRQSQLGANAQRR